MLDKLKRVKEGYKYLSAQDIPLWRNLLFILKTPKTVYKFIFVKNRCSSLKEGVFTHFYRQFDNKKMTEPYKKGAGVVLNAD